jgi:hypothetical protein
MARPILVGLSRVTCRQLRPNSSCTCRASPQRGPSSSPPAWGFMQHARHYSTDGHALWPQASISQDMTFWVEWHGVHY